MEPEMTRKNSDPPAGVRLPNAIAKGPHADALSAIGDNLRAAAAEAYGLPIEALSLEIVLEPTRRIRRAARERLS